MGSLDRDPSWAQGLRRLRDELGLAGRVSLLGILGDEELAGRYGAADLFVLPSRFEGYGMVFAEALAWGLPILASRAGAVGATVPPEAGLLVPADDPVALGQALRRLMADPALRRRLAQGARAAGLGLPTWRNAAAACAAALEEALDQADRESQEVSIQPPRPPGLSSVAQANDSPAPSPLAGEGWGEGSQRLPPEKTRRLLENAVPEVALDG